MTSDQTWLSHSYGEERETEGLWTALLKLNGEASPLAKSGEVRLPDWDAAEVYKKRMMAKETKVPKIPRQCPKAGCRKTQPCSIHPQGWANKDPSIPDLPDNWERLKKLVPKVGGCRWRLENGAICGSNHHLELDHIIPRHAGGTDSLINLQWLCRAHHRKKTSDDKKRYPKRRH